MYKKFLTARSPLRLLEKGLHGGLGEGNLGLVAAGHGVGKSSFLVGVALDHLLRGAHVLHAAIGQPPAHVHAAYETVFRALAEQTQLESAEQTRAEITRRLCIHTYKAADFGAGKLQAAAELARTALDAAPNLVVLEGLAPAALAEAPLAEWQQWARDLPAEMWLSAALEAEQVQTLPPELAACGDAFAVILALEPAADAVALRALKDHDNPDLSALHTALDPKTLLLKRS